MEGDVRGGGGYRSSRVGGIRELTSSQVEERQDRDGLWQSATLLGGRGADQGIERGRGGVKGTAWPRGGDRPIDDESTGIGSGRGRVAAESWRSVDVGRFGQRRSGTSRQRIEGGLVEGGTADEHGVADAKRWSSARLQAGGRHQLASFPHNDDLSCSDVSISIDDRAAIDFEHLLLSLLDFRGAACEL